MPGYVLAKLVLNDDVYHLVKNTPKVTGFLGVQRQAAADQRAEAARYFGAREGSRRQPRPKKRISVDYEIGDHGQGARRPVRQLQRRGRGAGFRQEPRQGIGLDLRSRDSGRARFRAGRIDEITLEWTKALLAASCTKRKS
jgi:hypothetical protein